ncbi:uncharacterized protein [Antedon mediterranea]|uniref:uncharacterized protein n=1 Tax=Antedon mediterranea TaxID=105859 RepID=UPI003AF9876A
MADENVKNQTATISISSKTCQLMKQSDPTFDDYILLTSSDEEVESKKDDNDQQTLSESAMVPVDNNNDECLSKNVSELDPADPTVVMKSSIERKKASPQNLFDAFVSGTPLLRQMVLFESDVILECKSCRNLFRNVNNFLDHKQLYCKDHVRSSCTTNQKMCMQKSKALWENHERTVVVNPTDDASQNIKKRKRATNNESKGTQVNLIGDSSEPHLLLRDIPATSEAIEQQVIIPRNIMYYDELDRSSAFQHVQLLHNDLDTTRLIGEITMRQVRKATMKNIEKRDALHNKLQNSNIDFYVDCDLQGVVSEKSGSCQKEKENSPLNKKEKIPFVSLTKTQNNDNETSRSVPNKCKFCKKICKNWTALAWHMRIHKRPKYKCPTCHYETPALYRMKRHLLHVHNKGVKEVDEVVKLVVQKTHQNNNNYSTETSVNENEPTCEICSKVFSSKRNLVRHREIHNRKGKRPGGGVMQKPDKKTKNEKRNTNPEEVEMARRNVFSIVDEKNLQCRKCKKSLSAWRRLVQHCCNHFGYNRYKCKGCSYENGDYTQMRRHMMCKHGRQFRSIQQISEAIRSMKVGIWVNFSLRSERNETNESNFSIDNKKVKKNESKLSQKKNLVPKKLSTETKKSDEKKSPEQKKLPSSDPKPDPKTSATVPKKLTESLNSNQENNGDEKKSEGKKTKEKESPSSTHSSPSKDSPSPVRSSPRINMTPSYVRITPLRTAKEKQDVAIKKEKLEEDKDSKDSLMDRKNLKCLKCSKQFQYLSTLRRHIHKHFEPEKSTNTVVERTQDCSKASIYKLINMQDMRCLKCFKRFNDLSSVKRHVERHLGLHSYNCQFCGYISHNFTWFKRHLVLKHSHHIKDEKHLIQLIGQMKATK